MKGTGILCIMLMVLFSVASADIVTVPGDQATIQAGINSAANGDTVLVEEGTYYENIRFFGKAVTLGSRFVIDGDTTHISRTIIDGSQPSNPDSGSVIFIVDNEDTNTVVAGLTVTGGTGSYVYWVESYIRIGGAFEIFDSGAKILHNRIVNNTVNTGQNVYGYGAAMELWGGEDDIIIVEDNLIQNNQVNTYWGGGGAVVMGTGNLIRFKQNTIIGNKHLATEISGGGAIYVWAETETGEGTIEISQNMFKGNRSKGGANRYYGWGGAIYVEDGDPLIANNVFAENEAGRGGALYVNSPTTGMRAKPVIVNNTVVNNTARWGSGLYVYNSNPVVFNNILWNHEATSDHLEISGTAGLYTYTTLSNNIIRNFSACGFEKMIFKCDPQLDPESLMPGAASPVIGMGTEKVVVEGVTLYAPGVDYTGLPRPGTVDDHIDIGAYETAYECKAHPVAQEMNKVALVVGADTLSLKVGMVNPHQHEVDVYSVIRSKGGTYADSIQLYDDGLHGDGTAGDNVYGGSYVGLTEEDYFDAVVKVSEPDHSRYYSTSQAFTTIGPVVFVDLEQTQYKADYQQLRFKARLWNTGSTRTAELIRGSISSADTSVLVIWNARDYGSITAGDTAQSTGEYLIRFDAGTEQRIINEGIQFDLKLESSRVAWWYDSFTFYPKIPVPELSPEQMDFGVIDIYTTKTMQAIVTNTGNAPLNILKVEAENPAFVIGDVSTTIEPGGDFSFDVTFTPTTRDTFSSALIISSDVGNWKTNDRFTGMTGISLINQSEIPEHFYLNQNYPNPFNPQTTINFGLPQVTRVRLLIYNLLGETVVTLVDERLPAGRYSYPWNGWHLPSGVYFYRLDAGNFQEVRKMILVK